MESSGGTPRRIFSGSTNNVLPTWSPSGGLIAFLGASRWNSATAGFNSRRLKVASGAAVALGSVFDATFAPDGRSFVYRGFDEKQKGVIVAVDVDGTNRHKLAEALGFAVSPLPKR